MMPQNREVTVSKETSETKVVTKTWKTVAKFDSFEEADKKRNVIIEAGKETKVRRCGPGGHQFAVKMRIDEKKPRAKSEKKTPVEAEAKLGDKRKEKRAKKRARRAERGTS